MKIGLKLILGFLIVALFVEVIEYLSLVKPTTIETKLRRLKKELKK